ncbi:hypothetical protein [Embleya sp. NBC_00888]|uniref:hypothetical protein n=1 Tax=Embleya sp. NBC_00888 TaxID=2975960 RepID=UPI003870EE5C
MSPPSPPRTRTRARDLRAEYEANVLVGRGVGGRRVFGAAATRPGPQDSPCRRWLGDGLATVGSKFPAEASFRFVPADRGRDLGHADAEPLGIVIGTAVDAWARSSS